MTWKLWPGPFKTSSVPVARRQAGSARIEKEEILLCRRCCDAWLLSNQSVSYFAVLVWFEASCSAFHLLVMLLTCSTASSGSKNETKKPTTTIATTILSSSHIKLWTIVFPLLLSLQQKSSVMMWAVCVSFDERRSETERAISTHIFSSDTCRRCYHGYRWCFAGPSSLPFFSPCSVALSVSHFRLLFTFWAPPPFFRSIHRLCVMWTWCS